MYPTTFHKKEVCVSRVDEQHETMESLRVLPVFYKNGEQCLVSAWLPTPEDLERLNKGLPLYLGVFMSAQPPVKVSTDLEEMIS